MTEKTTKSGISRRGALKTLGAGAAGLAGSGLFMPAVFAAKTVKIGFVSPQTGPLAAFGEPDAFTLDQLNKVLAGGVQSGGQNLPVEIIYKDSQSDSNRAAEAASELILKDNCDIIVAASTPATTSSTPSSATA